MGPTFNFNKKKKERTKALEISSLTKRVKRSEIFFNFSLLNLLSSIHGVSIDGFRRAKHEKCST